MLRKSLISLLLLLSLVTASVSASASTIHKEHKEHEKHKHSVVVQPVVPTPTPTPVVTTPVSTTTTTVSQVTVNPPYAVGTYNDFGMSIRLDINPKNSNASQFEIDWAPGYNATSGFQTKIESAATNFQAARYQWVHRTGVQATSMGWWTIKVISIGADGSKSAPFITNVNVIR